MTSNLFAVPPDSPSPTVVSTRSPLLLDGRASLCVIEEGSAILFVELVSEDGEPTGYRRRVATLDAGTVVPLPGRDFHGMRLVLVGIDEAVVRVLPPEETAPPRVRLTAGLERGIAAILPAVHASPASELAAALTLGPGEEHVFARAGTLSAHAPAWVEIRPASSGSPQLAGRMSEAGGGAPTVEAIGPGRALAIPAEHAVRVVDTASAVERFGRELLDDWSAEAFTIIGQRLYADMQARQDRMLRRQTSDRRRLDAALRELPELVRSGARPTATAFDGTAQGLVLEAVDQVCARERIAFSPPADATPDDDARRGARDVLRRANLRSRRIELEPGWWRDDLVSFIGFDAETGAPVPVLRRRAGYFETPQGGRLRRIDQALAGALDRDALAIFKPLPFTPLRGMDLVRHVLSTPARIDLRWAALFAVIAALLGLLPPYLVGILMNEVVPHSELGSLLHLALGLGVVAIGGAGFQAVRSVALLRIQAFADGSLQAAVWDRLQRLPLAFFRQYQVGDLLIKATGPTQLRQALSDTVLGSAMSAIFSVINFALMLSYDSRLAVAALLFSLAAGVLLLGLSWLQLLRERQRLKAEGMTSSLTIQLLVGVQKLRLMGAENRAFARWVASFAEHRRQTIRAARIGNVTMTSNAVLPILASLLFFYLAGTAEKAMPVGDFIAFNAAFGVFNAALLGLVGAVSTSMAVVPIYENMKPILAAQPEIDLDRKPPGPLHGGIEMRAVSFRYDAGGPPVLDGVDLTAAPGQFVALVGPSGSGKSTILRMLLGFERPAAGFVGYDGQDLAHLDLKAVRRQLGVVLQRGTLLPGSMFENIVGSAPLTHDDAWEAARMAGLDEDIKGMPMGMHTLIAEGGGTLSGGQRQRLMIARAIVRRPRILLMDEATSALDNRTQGIVSESLQHLNATRVVIAHRLSTIVKADRIYVLEAGRIVQAGTYDELIGTPGAFQRLAARQLK